MKYGAWLGLTSGLALWLAGPAAAQSVAGVWQGVEFTPGATPSAYWPQVLTLHTGPGTALTGEIYQVAGSGPALAATFAVRGNRTPTGLRLRHAGLLTQSQPSKAGWCQGTLVFRYEAATERLIGRSAYTGADCYGGPTEFSRVVLKSAAAVPREVPSVLRVSGRNVRWFADAALRRPLATGNTYRTRLAQTTTFYLTQGFYTTSRSPVAAVTVRVVAPAKAAAPLRPTPPTTTKPLLAVAPVAAPATVPAAQPSQALPSVLFQVATAELLPTAAPALDSLAAVLRRYPALRFRIEGHTDRLGESDKNLTLSQQRTEAVKAFLVKAGIAPTRLETVGYGDSRPAFVAPNPGNRRVEIRPLPPTK